MTKVEINSAARWLKDRTGVPFVRGTKDIEFDFACYLMQLSGGRISMPKNAFGVVGYWDEMTPEEQERSIRNECSNKRIVEQQIMELRRSRVPHPLSAVDVAKAKKLRFQG